MKTLDPRSADNLANVHVDLVAVVVRAMRSCSIDFIVTEGLRSIAKQRQLVDAGASKTMDSRHLTGHAVDVAARVNGRVRWDWPPYEQIAYSMKKEARKLGIELEWGGDWTSFRDGPHFQLAWEAYPKDGDIQTEPEQTADATQEDEQQPDRCTNLILHEGHAGPCVTLIQKALNDWRISNNLPMWPLAADGQFGSNTKRRVTKFQAAQGLTADGIVGSDTWHYLKEYP